MMLKTFDFTDLINFDHSTQKLNEEANKYLTDLIRSMNLMSNMRFNTYNLEKKIDSCINENRLFSQLLHIL